MVLIAELVPRRLLMNEDAASVAPRIPEMNPPIAPETAARVFRRPSRFSITQLRMALTMLIIDGSSWFARVICNPSTVSPKRFMLLSASSAAVTVLASSTNPILSSSSAALAAASSDSSRNPCRESALIPNRSTARLVLTAPSPILLNALRALLRMVTVSRRFPSVSRTLIPRALNFSSLPTISFDRVRNVIASPSVGIPRKLSVPVRTEA